MAAWRRRARKTDVNKIVTTLITFARIRRSAHLPPRALAIHHRHHALFSRARIINLWR